MVEDVRKFMGDRPVMDDVWGCLMKRMQKRLNLL